VASGISTQCIKEFLSNLAIPFTIKPWIVLAQITILKFKKIEKKLAKLGYQILVC
jgi:hypothetical protein